MLQAPSYPVARAAHGGAVACRTHSTDRKSHNDNSFERLTRIYRDGEMLLDQLRRTQTRLAQARAYLESDGCNVALGRALVDRLRDRKSWLVARLRANRMAAYAVLGLPITQNHEL